MGIASGLQNSSGKQLTVQEVLANPAIQNAINMNGQSCSCPATGGAGPGNSIYPTPNSFTLVATGAAGGANNKLQSFDNVVESVNGTLGTNGFTVNELPNRAGLAFGGGTLLGVDALRASLATYAVLVSYVNYKASTSDQLSNPLKVYRGSIDGTVTQVTKSVSKDISNMQYNATLVPINGEWLLTSNTALQVFINDAVVVNLTFAVKSLIPYNKVL